MTEEIESSRIADLPLAVVDVETTGLSPRSGDRVCEIAVIRRDPDGTVQRYVSFVDPQRPISAGAFAVNGITPQMLKGAPTFDAIRPQLDEVLEGAVFIAHNAPFDFGFLQSEYARCSREFTVPAILDTRLLSKRYLRLYSNSLASVARHLRIAQPNAHRALADCETTLCVFDAIIEQAQLADTPLRDIMSVPPAPSPTRPAVDALPDGLSDLIRREGVVEITYLTANGSRSRRAISEISVVQSGEHVYLTGHCSLRNAERQFRLDRILHWNPVQRVQHEGPAGEGRRPHE